MNMLVTNTIYFSTVFRKYFVFYKFNEIVNLFIKYSRLFFKSNLLLLVQQSLYIQFLHLVSISIRKGNAYIS